MIAFGSSCGYNYIDEYKKEDRFLYGSPDDSVYWYASTKRNLLIGLMGYAKQYDMRYTYFIPTTLYGPGFIDRDSHFIFDLVRKIVDARCKNKDKVTLWGDGNQIRGLLYIDDAIDTIVNNIDTNHNRVNLMSTIHRPISYYASVICKHVGYPMSDIHYNKEAFVGATSKYLPGNKWVPTTYNVPFETGIGQTIDYYKAHRGYQ